MLLQVYGDNTIMRNCDFETHEEFRDDDKKMKDESRSRRRPTSCTEVNDERVRPVECGDGRLTIRMIASLVDIKKNTMFERLSLKIWACLKSNRTGCAGHLAVPGRNEYQRTGTISLFA